MKSNRELAYTDTPEDVFNGPPPPSLKEFDLSVLEAGPMIPRIHDPDYEASEDFEAIEAGHTGRGRGAHLMGEQMEALPTAPSTVPAPTTRKMRLVERSGPGEVELQYLWLPTFLGMNSVVKAELEAYLSPILVGRELTDDALNEAHDAVVARIQEKFPSMKGLSDYLDAVKFVQVNG